MQIVALRSRRNAFRGAWLEHPQSQKTLLTGAQGEYKNVPPLAALHSEKPFSVPAFADPFGVIRLTLQATEYSYIKHAFEINAK